MLGVLLLLAYPKVQFGYATVYADKFHGRRTASGEIYDRNKLTAAHPYLPFGTLVKVVNTENGRSVKVRINDRFIPKAKRIINLSHRASKLIGMKGKAKVKVIVLKIPKGKEKFVQVGYASYYGRKFHGRTTACGIKFNMYKMYAAHKTLPCGTLVKVTNLENGRSVKVRIVDRGPFKKGRIVDLSYKAAKLLGMVKKGVVKVKLEVVSWK